MHHYLIDERVARNTASGQLNRIRSWVKTSRIAGEQSDLKSPQHIIEQVKKIAASSPSATIVVLGDDLSLDLAISALTSIENGSKIPLGYIPLHANTQSSQALNITDWKQAVAALLKGKRENFDLLSVEDYAILSYCKLTPKQPVLAIKHSATLLLDKKLTIDIPSSELTLTNTSKDPVTEHVQPILIEATASQSTDKLLQNKQPLISLPIKQNPNTQAKMLRLKASTITIETASPLLLQGLIQLRATIQVTQLNKQQALIVSKKRDSLA